MPNQLSLPTKKTYVLPIREAVDRHIRNKHPETHPDAFKADVDRWEVLRAAAVEPRVHVETASAIVQCVALPPGGRSEADLARFSQISRPIGLCAH